MIGQLICHDRIRPVYRQKAAALAEKIVEGTPFKAKEGGIFLGRRRHHGLDLVIQDGRAWLYSDAIDLDYYTRDQVLLASVTLDERYRVHKLKRAAAEYFRKVYSRELREAEAEVTRINAILENIYQCV